MDCSMPGSPVLHHLPEFAQTHVRWVGDALPPFCSLSSPSPAAFNFSQQQGLFQWVGSFPQVAKVLKLQLQHLSFQWIFRVDLISLQSKGLSRVFPNTTVRKHHFFGAWPSLWSNSHIPYMTTGKTTAFTIGTFVGKMISLLFIYAVWVCLSFSFKEQVSFNFMAAVTIRNDFGTRENKVCHCFRCSPIYLPWSDGTRYHGTLRHCFHRKPEMSSLVHQDEVRNYITQKAVSPMTALGPEPMT